MRDIWGFLLQTLTASGVAVLLLIIKALFRDKLPPKWHFAVWSALGIVLLIPSGLGGRYALFHWQFLVEIIKTYLGDYSLTRVLFPIPILSTLPRSVTDWIFAVYVLGVLIFVVKYAVSYIKLRAVLRSGTAPCAETVTHIAVLAAMQNIKLCKIIEVSGLPSAFVCGIFRPILALPADKQIDDKVILHELLHLKHKDAFWNAVICLLRCLHWCNPLLVYCANRAINDLESRCDQYVLERLEGEARRDYGRILLSMANDRFAKTPGSTSINNGGKNIRNRIEAIARFKKYPVGMQLVSVCVMILLIFSLVVGVQATNVYSLEDFVKISIASAKSTPCTTVAGALDTYAKSIITQNGIYRIMCASEDLQTVLIGTLTQKNMTDLSPEIHTDFSAWLDPQNGYYIYNLKSCGKQAYEALLVMELETPNVTEEWDELSENGEEYVADDWEKSGNDMLLVVQNLRIEKENDRWIVIPLEELRTVDVWRQSLEWGCNELPGWAYTGTTDDFQVKVLLQTVRTVDNAVQDDNTFSQLLGFTSFDTIPKPNAKFSKATRNHCTTCTHLGTQEERDNIVQIGLTTSPVYAETKYTRYDIEPTWGNYGGSNNLGDGTASHQSDTGWGSIPTINFGGGGSTFEPNQAFELPEYYTAKLYINHTLFTEMELHLQEGATQ